MKKKVNLFIVAIIMAFTLVGCNDIPATETVQEALSSESKIPTYLQPSEQVETTETVQESLSSESKIPTDLQSSEQVEATEDNIKIFTATDELLEEFSSYHEYTFGVTSERK